jgi:hypothetical protein
MKKPACAEYHKAPVNMKKSAHTEYCKATDRSEALKFLQQDILNATYVKLND